MFENDALYSSKIMLTNTGKEQQQLFWSEFKHLFWNFVSIQLLIPCPIVLAPGMCRCEGYGFEALYSGIGYINHWESLGLEKGIIFQETDQLVEGFSLNKGNRELPLKNMKKIKSASSILPNSA